MVRNRRVSMEVASFGPHTVRRLDASHGSELFLRQRSSAPSAAVLGHCRLGVPARFPEWLRELQS
jgi:hypothetical protein